MKVKAAFIIVFVFFMNSAGVADSLLPAAKTDTMLAAFARKLVDRKFGEFFIYPMHDQTIDAVWADSTNHRMLDELIEAPDISAEAKFLACEVLRQKDIFYTRRHSAEKIAGIYTQALVNDYTHMANSWGLLYDQMDDGTVGIYFIMLRKSAVQPLVKLLDNESTNLFYEGSIEATIGNGYKYRIKDFAAYYLGRMMGKPLKYYPALPDRDKQIEQLKKDLQSFDFDK